MTTATEHPPIDPTEHFGLVGSIVKLYQGKGIEWDELEGEGMFGLAMAVQNYDPATGNQFSTYAYWCIKRRIQAALAKRYRRNALLPAYGYAGTEYGADLVDRKSDPDAQRRGPNHDLVDRLHAALNALPRREAEVLRRYFGLAGHSPQTFQAIADSLGVTKERTRQIRTAGLRRLQKRFGVDLRATA